MKKDRAAVSAKCGSYFCYTVLVLYYCDACTVYTVAQKSPWAFFPGVRRLAVINANLPRVFLSRSDSSESTCRYDTCSELRRESVAA